MAKAPTVEDVARVAGVSRQTVSNVLNSPGIVRESTRERVQSAIAELGYRRHAAARRLRTRRSSTIGIHLDPYAGGISGVVLDRFVHALTELAGARGMRIQLYAARTPEEEISRMAELIEGAEIDAVVVTGTFHDDPRTRWLTDRGTPFVSFGRPWGVDDLGSPAHPWVDVDGAAGTRQATEWALSRVGPRVAFLGWPAGSGTGDDRESGWRGIMDPLGVRPMRLTAGESIAEAREAVAAALSDSSSQPFDALVCASDSLAVGAHLAAVAAGCGGLPVVGFDNTPVCEAMGISSVEQLPEEVATGMLSLLLDAENASDAGGDAPWHVLVEPRLIAR